MCRRNKLPLHRTLPPRGGLAVTRQSLAKDNTHKKHKCRPQTADHVNLPFLLYPLFLPLYFYHFSEHAPPQCCFLSRLREINEWKTGCTYFRVLFFRQRYVKLFRVISFGETQMGLIDDQRRRYMVTGGMVIHRDGLQALH